MTAPISDDHARRLKALRHRLANSRTDTATFLFSPSEVEVALAEVDRLTQANADLLATLTELAPLSVAHERDRALAERDQARELVRAAHSQAEGWRNHALEHRGETGYTVMAHACCCVLTALAGGQDATLPDWATGNGDET